VATPTSAGSPRRRRREGLEDTSWGLIWAKYLDTSESYTVAKQYYGYGNFTKFIRPGYDIIASNDSHTTAAYNPASGKVVLVVYNNNTTSRYVDYDLSKFGAISAAAPYRTSGTEALAQLDDVSMTGNHLITTLAPKSVTTFVMPGITKGGQAQEVVSALSNKCASVSGWSTADGAALVQWACGSGSANQQWKLQPAGDGQVPAGVEPQQQVRERVRLVDRRRGGHRPVDVRLGKRQPAVEGRAGR